MARKKTKDSSSQYFGVCMVKDYRSSRIGYSKSMWRAKATTQTERLNTYHDTEREAAIAVDRFLIRHGLEPKNILKRKN